MGGATHRALLLRESLMEWWSIIRHSVDTKVMVRLPKAVFLVKAQQLQCEYCAECLKHNRIPESVDVNHRWINLLLASLHNLRQETESEVQSTTGRPAAKARYLFIVTAKLRTLVMVPGEYSANLVQSV